MFLIGVVSVLGLIMFVFYAVFLPTGTKEWTIWVIGSVGVLLGCILGYFLMKLVRLGVCALGAWQASSLPSSFTQHSSSISTLKPSSGS
jgi:hypothetical protein